MSSEAVSNREAKTNSSQKCQSSVRYRLRTLLIVAAILPALIAGTVIGYKGLDSWLKRESSHGLQRGQAGAAANAFETKDNGDGTFTILTRMNDGTISTEVHHYSKK